MTDDIVLCPQCGRRIPISATLTSQIRSTLATEFSERLDGELERVRQESATQVAAAQQLTADLELQKRGMESELARRLEGALDSQKRSMEEELAKRLESVRAQAEAEAVEKARGELERARGEAATQAATAQRLTADLDSQKRSMEEELAKRLESVRAQAEAEAVEKASGELERARGEAATQAATAQRLTADLDSQKRSMEGEFAKKLERARTQAQMEAADKARLELERVTQEASAQKAAAQKLTVQLESQQKSMAGELARRLEIGRKQAEADAVAKSGLELSRVRREAAEQVAIAKRLSSQLETQKREMEVELKRQLLTQRKSLETDIEQKLADANRSRELATLRQLSDARTQIDDLKRKLEASSRQLEGEAVEADLHSLLSKAYPNDEIRALSKRGGGADVHQVVYSPSGKEAGSIIWECKNTAVWNNGWVAKLRQDQRRVRADVAVLVSAARPRDCGRLELRDGIWITEHPLAVGVAAVFRTSLLQLSQYKDLPPETAERFAVIQRYLSSTEFRHRIEAILEAFQTMSSDLAAEKRSAERHWAQREKQLQLVVENVSGMYGELRAVTGPTLARVRRLELPSVDSD